MGRLRKSLIRLAYRKPELREHLLPILTSTGVSRLAASKPLSPEKLQELLLKIRKGSTTSFTLSQIQAVVEHLGGEMSMGVSWVRKEDSVGGDRFDALVDAVKPLFVKSLPSNPKPGKVFFMEMPKPRDYIYLEYFVSVPTVEFTFGGMKASVPGTAYDYVVRDLAYARKPAWISSPPRSYDVTPKLIEAGLKEKVNEVLGLEEHIPSAQRTRENTGHCSVCLDNVKLKNGRIVLHGYRRPGWGFVQGSCFGVNHPPYELSDRGTRNYLDYAAKQIDKALDLIRDLNSGKVEMESSEAKKALIQAKREAAGWEAEKERAADLVSKWKVRPLPVEGGPLLRLDR